MIGLGHSYTCGLWYSARVLCRGRDWSGTLGRGDLVSEPFRVPVGPPTDEPIIAIPDIIVESSSLAAGDTVYGRTQVLDQNGLTLPVPAAVISSDSTVARVEHYFDTPTLPAHGFRVIGVSRGTAVLNAVVGNLPADVTVVVN